MQSLLLGAGYATRLYPLTKDRPKPLLPLGGVPILSRTCERLFQIEELKRICVVSNHRFVRHYYNWLRDFEERRSFPCSIEIFDDLTTSNDDRLGAIGDMDFVIQHGKIESPDVESGQIGVADEIEQPARDAGKRRLVPDVLVANSVNGRLLRRDRP